MTIFMLKKTTTRCPLWEATTPKHISHFTSSVLIFPGNSEDAVVYTEVRVIQKIQGKPDQTHTSMQDNFL